TFHTLAGPEVDPISSSWEINRPLSRSLGGYWIDQQRVTEHELVRHSSRSRVGSKLERQGPHERFAVVSDAPGGGIDVRHQTISQLIVLRKDVLCLWTVIPNLRIRFVSVNAENGAERAVLKPPDQQFVVR